MRTPTRFLFVLWAVAALPALGCGSSSDPDGLPPEELIPPEPAVIVVSPVYLPDAVATRPWLASLYATGGTPPYAWALASGPAWLAIDPATGLLWGRPPDAAVGSVALTVSVSDAETKTGTGHPTFEVVPEVADQPPIVLAAAGQVHTDHFATADACVACHSNDGIATAMRDAADRAIGMYDLWVPSLMADAMRDPYHRAVLRAEVAALPNLQATIEDACMRCHAPLLSYELHEQGDLATLDIAYGDDDAARLALDGDSCAICHTMVDRGTEDVFDGRYEVNDEKRAWAPHASPFRMPMLGSAGFDPSLGTHVTESAFCATCHVLRVPTFAPDGTPLDATFPEQTPYFEWQNSVFSTEVEEPSPAAASCQDCHMPPRDADGQPITTAIARRPHGGDFSTILPRTPYGRHLLLAGNAFMLSVLRDQAADLRPHATTVAFDDAIGESRRMLRQDTATLAVQNVERSASGLAFDVRVTNRTGHKLPTSYPSRRAWLRVVVRDEAGAVIFASGQVDATGTMVDMAGRVLPSEAAHGPVQPHRDRVTRTGEVAIWEAVAQDADGEPTWHLLTATDWRKDNRLLPLGWRDDHPHYAEIEPHGIGDDADFQGGGDTVHYAIGVVPVGVLSIEVTLLYQSISARAVYELLTDDELPEVNVFRQYWKAADRTPEVLDRRERAVP